MTRAPQPRIRVTLAGFVALLLIGIACGAWAGEYHWIDVRSVDEFAEDHLDAAVNIPYTEIAARIGEVTDDRAAPIYLYCRSGRRAAIAQAALQAAGYTNVTNVGGLQDARNAVARSAACAQQRSPDCLVPKD